jgi:hypothetical protein
MGRVRSSCPGSGTAIDSVLKIGEGDSAGGSVMIQALDVDRAEPWPHGQDRQEDQAPPI